MTEHEPRPGDTPLSEALRRYSLVMYKLQNEGEASYDNRLLHATFELDTILEHFSLHDATSASALRDRLLPNPAENLPFREDFSTMRLAPLRLIAEDHIPSELLTPRSIELCFDVAVRVGGDVHANCIGDHDSVRCEIQLVCPAKASRELGVKLLGLLSIQQGFSDVMSGETAAVGENIQAVKLRMTRLGLAIEPEVENIAAQQLQAVRAFYLGIIDDAPEENRGAED